MSSSAKVTGLWIYPVKSCRGISLQKMQIGPTGPLHDRQWMIVDSANQFLTLRTESKLSLIKTSLQGQYLHLYFDNNKILINIEKDCFETETVQVWKDQVIAGVENTSVNDALSDFLGRTVKLVRYQKQSFRDISKKNAASNVVKETMFADAHPVLLVNQNSLEDLNDKLNLLGQAPSVIERYRANIIISGWSAFYEDQVKTFQIGQVKFSLPKLCARCPIVTQDVETGKIVSKETLKVMSEYRRIGPGSGVMFGVNLTPMNLGEINVGDDVVDLSN